VEIGDCEGKENERAQPGAITMKRNETILNSSWSFILILVVVFFFVEIAAQLLITSMFEGVNELNTLTDPFISSILIMPFLWWLVKNSDRFLEKLKESEERFRTLFEGGPDAIFLADPETGIIIDANTKASELIGRPREEIIGMDQARLHLPQIDKYSRETIKEHGLITKQKQYIRPFENLVLRPDGTEIPVEVLAQMVNLKGKPVIQGVFRDITERKSTEDMLKKSKESFSKAEKIGHFGYWEWDLATNKLIWSDEVFRLYGLDPKKVTPTYETVVSTLSAQTRDWFMKAIDDALNNNVPFEGEYSLIRPDGTVRYTHTIGEVIRDREGKPISMFGVVQDITERKQTEDRLILFRNLIESSNDAICVNDPETGQILDANDRACVSLGYEREELLKMCVFDFEVTMPDKFFWKEHVKEIQSKGHMILEGRHRRKNGTIFPVEVNVSYVVAGKISYLLAVVRDITERKQAEEDLLKFKLGIERSDEVIFITNIDGSIIYANPAFEKIYGYNRAEVIGKTPRILKSGLLTSEAYKPFWDTLLTKKVVKGELVNKTKDGHLLNIDGSANPILDDKGNIVGFLAIQRDITERKHSEEALRESEERFRKVFEEGPIGMVLTSRDLKFFSANPAFRQMLGYTEEEMSIRTFLDVTHPEHRNTDRENVEKLWQGKIPYYRTEKRYIKKNGDICWGNLSTTIVRGQDGKPLYALAMVEDITKRKCTEEELNESHNLLDAINRAQSQFIQDSDSGIIFDDLLKNLLNLTSSEYGLIGEVLHNTKDEPYLKIHAITNIAWTKDMKEFCEENAPKGMEFHNLNTLFNAVITTGKPVISINPPSDPRRGGFPKGHPAINSFLGLPFYRGDKLVGLVGLANRPEGYNEELEEYLSPMLNTCANIIEAYRTDQKRKQSEEQVKASLKEKETLLREIHHRVKNNMQIISSLLGLQAESIKEKKYLDMINDSRNRIISMYMIHEKLYRSNDLEKIEISKYIRDLANGLLQSYGDKQGTIELDVNVNDTSFGIDFAIPCGLIINELITNSLKYAFPDGRKGKINVSLHPFDENMFELIVSDNGAGIPHDVDFRKTESLGLRLVTILAENQLQGMVDLDRSKGTEFTIKFKGVK